MNKEPQALTGEFLEQNLTRESSFLMNLLAMILLISSPQSRTKQWVVRGVRHKVELSWRQGEEELQIPKPGGRGSPWGRTEETPKVPAYPRSSGRPESDSVQDHYSLCLNHAFASPFVRLRYLTSLNLKEEGWLLVRSPLRAQGLGGGERSDCRAARELVWATGKPLGALWSAPCHPVGSSWLFPLSAAQAPSWPAPACQMGLLCGRHTPLYTRNPFDPLLTPIRYRPAHSRRSSQLSAVTPYAEP